MVEAAGAELRRRVPINLRSRWPAPFRLVGPAASCLPVRQRELAPLLWQTVAKDFVLRPVGRRQQRVLRLTSRRTRRLTSAATHDEEQPEREERRRGATGGAAISMRSAAHVEHRSEVGWSTTTWAPRTVVPRLVGRRRVRPFSVPQRGNSRGHWWCIAKNRQYDCVRCPTNTGRARPH